MKTVSEIIAHWPRVRDFADDCGVRWMTAYQWRERNNIPPEHWATLVEASKRRGYPVDEKVLIELAASKKQPVQGASKKSETEAAA